VAALKRECYPILLGRISRDGKNLLKESGLEADEKYKIKEKSFQTKREIGIFVSRLEGGAAVFLQPKKFYHYAGLPGEWEKSTNFPLSLLRSERYSPRDVKGKMEKMRPDSSSLEKTSIKREGTCQKTKEKAPTGGRPESKEVGRRGESEVRLKNYIAGDHQEGKNRSHCSDAGITQ